MEEERKIREGDIAVYVPHEKVKVYFYVNDVEDGPRAEYDVPIIVGPEVAATHQMWGHGFSPQIHRVKDVDVVEVIPYDEADHIRNYLIASVLHNYQWDGRVWNVPQQ